MDNLVDESYLRDLPLWSDDEARAVLSEVCEKHGVPIDVPLSSLTTIKMASPDCTPTREQFPVAAPLTTCVF